jgi:hypothetical protein
MIDSIPVSGRQLGFGKSANGWPGKPGRISKKSAAAIPDPHDRDKGKTFTER